MQTLNISKLYINKFNNNSKCNSLQDQKILNNSVLTKPYWLSFKRTSVSKTNKCTPTQYWHDSWKFHIQYMENVCVFLPHRLSETMKYVYFIVWSWHFLRQSLIMKDTTNQLKESTWSTLRLHVSRDHLRFVWCLLWLNFQKRLIQYVSLC